MHNRLARLIAALVPLMLPVALLAQAGDVRISPIEPHSYPFPLDIRIQSAARIDDVSLVAWGSTRYLSDSSISGALYFQLVRDTVAVGLPQLLHDTSARPAGVVSVVAASGRFLVLWNDRRTVAPGIYLRWIDADGTFIGSEEHFSDGQIYADSTVALLGFEGQQRLVWTDRRDSSGSIYWRELDLAGNVVGNEAEIAPGVLRQVLSYSTIPHYWVLVREGHKPIAIDSNLEIQVISLPVGTMDLPFYLDADRTYMLIEGDSLHYFGNVADSIPVRSIGLPRVGPGLSTARSLRRDSSGVMHVVWPVITTDYGYRFNVAMYDAPIIGNVVGDSTLVVMVVQEPYIPFYYFAYEFQYVRRRSHCDNRVQSAIYFTETVQMKTSRTVNNAVMVFDESGSLLYRQTYLASALARAIPCDSRSTLLCGRIHGDSTSSTVTVSVSGKSVVVRTPIVPSDGNLVQSEPGICFRNGKIIVTWEQQASLESYVLGTVTMDQSPSYVGIDTISFEGPSGFQQSTNPLDGLRGVETQVRRNHYLLDNATLVEAGTILLIYPDGGGGLSNIDYSLFTPTDTGWRNSKSLTLQDGGYMLNGLSYVRNPGTGDILANVTDAFRKKRWVFNLDSTGTESWSDDGLVPNELLGSLLPVGMRDFYGLFATVIRRYQNGQQESEGVLDPPPGFGPIHQLLGRQFLSIILPDSTRSTMLLRRYSLDGTFIDSTVVSLPAQSFDYFLCQSTTDSVIAMLYGSPLGVRGTFIRQRDMKVLALDSLLSSTIDSVRNPSGVFDGDTLFLVWEDFRNGRADIYGTSWSVPGSFNTMASPQSDDDIQSIQINGNPTSDRTLIMFSIATGSTMTVELIDPLGRLVRQDAPREYLAGKHTLDLSLADLHPGAYTVVLRAGRSVATARLIVLH